jgi:hypothetical protein
VKVPTRIWVDRPLLESRRRNPGSRPILVQAADGEIRRGRVVYIKGPAAVVYDQHFAPALVRVETFAEVEIE